MLMTLVVATSCATAEKKPAIDEKTPMVLHKADYEALPGWAQDDHAAALRAFARSCGRIARLEPARPFSRNIQAGTIGDWQKICAAMPADDKAAGDAAAARAFFERSFEPYAARAQDGPAEGLFTGYYEASLRGSLVRQGPYQYPLHRRPADLVMVELGDFREELKGQRIAGRVRDGKLAPYEERARIVAGDWPHGGDDNVLVWVDDPVDAFFLQIQGSGVVTMEDGTAMRVGYDGQNGHVYYAIGRELVKRGLMAKEDVSMQSIRAWLAAYPDQAGELMDMNRSYVFFRVLEGDGPLGAENVVLSAGRSLAVDSGKMAYGVPVWVDLGAPVAEEGPIRRLMVAQDTGGAIRGAVRGDVYFGYGERAEYLAGKMKARGRYWLLLPRVMTH